MQLHFLDTSEDCCHRQERTEFLQRNVDTLKIVYTIMLEYDDSLSFQKIYEFP